MIVLHGPDWVIESSIKPSCLPERDVVFRSDVGEGLMAHPSRPESDYGSPAKTVSHMSESSTVPRVANSEKYEP